MFKALIVVDIVVCVQGTYSDLHFVLRNEMHSAATDVTEGHIPTRRRDPPRSSR